MRPWISDVRPEEYTPSYAGRSAKVDFLLPDHNTVIETKIVRDRGHARKVGQELIVDIAHYGAHPKCYRLWCVIYDPNRFIENGGGLASDLEGLHKNSNGSVSVRLVIV